MSASISLSERGLRAMLAVVEDGRRDAPGPGLPWAALDRLSELIGCDTLVLCEMDLHQERTPLEQSVEGGERLLAVDSDDDDLGSRLYWKLYRDFLPCHDPARPRDVRVIRWSDVYTEKELYSAPLYVELYRDCGARQRGMMVEFPAQPGHTRRLLFWRRSGRDFSHRDQLILELLWPHLYEIYQDAELRRRGREVLELAAQGHSNADIARLLFISLSTVRKHMEHIFDRTGARSRTAAVALMMPRLTMPDRRPPSDR